MYARTLIVAVAAVTAASAPVSAQSLATPTARTLAVSSAREEGPDAARIRAMLEKADEALVAGHLSEARKTYRAVIDAQHEAAQYAGEALWHLASVYFFSDEIANASDTLDELAAEAARFGDPSMELRATFESAVMSQSIHRTAGVSSKIARVKALLQSPAIKDSQKAEVTSRMANE